MTTLPTAADILSACGLDPATLSGGSLAVHSPIDGARIAALEPTAPSGMPGIRARANAAFAAWRQVPAPRRGELVRPLGEELRASQEALGPLAPREARA